MNINFQQGIIAYPSAGSAQSFLTYSSGYVSLSTANGHVDVTVANGSNNYLISESISVPQAWGPLPSNTDCWLYWDIDARTAVRTFGFSTVAPTYSISQPATALDGQLWFNPSTKIMYVATAGVYRTCLRVFAAKVNSSTFTPLGSGNSAKPFSGSQAGLNLSGVTAGRIIVDSNGKPIRVSDGSFFTSESDIYFNGSPVNAVRLESSIITAKAAAPIAQFQIVKLTDFELIAPAAYDDVGTTAIAIAMEDITTGAVGTICAQGMVTNPAWNWTTAGAALWVTTGGVLTETDPHVANAFVYPTESSPVGRVFGTDSIIFSQGENGTGGSGAGGASKLADLTDVALNSPANGQALLYNSTDLKWENGNIGLMTIKNLTGDYTLLPTDVPNTLFRVSSSSDTTITIPTNGDAPLPIGMPILIGRVGIGRVFIAAADGVTVNAPTLLEIATQHGIATAIKVDTNVWDAEGNLVTGA